MAATTGCRHFPDRRRRGGHTMSCDQGPVAVTLSTETLEERTSREQRSRGAVVTSAKALREKQRDDVTFQGGFSPLTAQLTSAAHFCQLDRDQNEPEVRKERSA